MSRPKDEWEWIAGEMEAGDDGWVLERALRKKTGGSASRPYQTNPGQL